jgi:predicted N-acetyltransferase YhbS
MFCIIINVISSIKKGIYMSQNAADLIVDLYAQDFKKQNEHVTIKRVLSPDSDLVLSFIEKHFNKRWVSEAKSGLYKPQSTCFIAVKDKDIVGFACYDATSKGYFGPMGVDEAFRGQSIGQSLVAACLEAMYFDGYGYAIIGAVSSHTWPFYFKTCGATPIDDSRKLYSRLYDR